MAGIDVLAAAAIMAATTAAMSAAASASQGSQLRKQAAQTKRIGAYNVAQNNIALEDTRNKINKSLFRYLGAIDASASERMVGFSGSTAAAETSSRLQALEDTTNAKYNTDSANISARLDTDQRVQALYAQISNPLFEGIKGGIGGFSTGLQLGRGIQDLNTA